MYIYIHIYKRATCIMILADLPVVPTFTMGSTDLLRFYRASIRISTLRFSCWTLGAIGFFCIMFVWFYPSTYVYKDVCL